MVWIHNMVMTSSPGRLKCIFPATNCMADQEAACRGVLVIDPAIHAGWVHLDVDSEDVLGWGSFDAQGEDEQSRLTSFHGFVEKLLGEQNPKEVVTETYMFSRFKCNGAMFNAYVRGSIIIACGQKQLPLSFVNVGDWKRYVCGKGGIKASKTQIQESLATTWGCSFPLKMKIGVSNKELKFRHDVADAVGILIYHCSQKSHKIIKCVALEPSTMKNVMCLHPRLEGGSKSRISKGFDKIKASDIASFFTARDGLRSEGENTDQIN